MEAEISWEWMKENKQKRINANNTRENKKRVPHECKAGDLMTVTRPGIIPKLSLPRMGLHSVVQAHGDGTVTVQKELTVTDRVDVQRLQPFCVQEDWRCEQMVNWIDWKQICMFCITT